MSEHFVGDTEDTVTGREGQPIFPLFLILSFEIFEIT